MSKIFINTYETKRFNALKCYISKNKESNYNNCNEIKNDVINIKTEITEDDVKEMFGILKNAEDVKNIVEAYYNKNKAKDSYFTEKRREKILQYIDFMENAFHFRETMLNEVRKFKKIKFTDKLVDQLSYLRGKDIYNYQRSAFFVFDNAFYKKISKSFEKFDKSLKNSSAGFNIGYFNGIKNDLKEGIKKIINRNTGHSFTVCR